MTEKTPLVPIVKFSSLNIIDKISSTLEYSNLETYSLLWLEPSASETKEYFDAQQRFRTSINYIKIFKTTDECEQYLQLVPNQDRVLFVVNHQIGQEFVPRIHHLQPIFAIYIYSYDQKRSGTWTKEFPKIKSVHTQLDPLIAQIKSDRVRRSHNKIDEPLHIHTFHPRMDFKLNNRFIRGQLLVDCLLGLQEITSDRPKLVQICQEHYKENKNELVTIHEFEENYAASRALRWYTRQSFLTRIFQKALRMENIDLLFLFRFFIHDLQKQIIKNQYTQPQRLYRAQLISYTQLDILKQALGGFMMINSFLSTTIDRDLSLAHFDQVDSSDGFEMKRVLFEIDADPRIDGMKPFANIIWLSYCFGQQEVLIMMGSIFRVLEIQDDGKDLTIMRLSLCSELDPELKETFEQLRRDYRVKDMNLLTFGHTLSEITSFEEAKKFYLHLLKDLPSDHQDLATCYHALGNVAAEKGDFDLCLEWYGKLLSLLSQTLKSDDPRLADSHSMIGSIYAKKDDLKHALDSYNKAFAIYKQAYGEHHLSVAECSDRIAEIYEKEKKYFQALNHYEKSLSIRQKVLGLEDLQIAMTHSKLAGVRLSLCHYYLALGHYNIAMKIKSNTLPPEHLDFASDYRGMGHIYRARGELNQALNYYQKALEIYRNLLPADDPIVIEMDRSIRFLSTQTK